MVDAIVGQLEDAFIQQHQHQLETSGVNRIYWKSLFNKLNGKIYDAGDHFEICRLSYKGDSYEKGDPIWQVVVKNVKGITTTDANNIFLVDHAWTFQNVNEAMGHLKEIPGLLERMALLMDIRLEDYSQPQLTQRVIKEMWKFNGTYSINNLQDVVEGDEVTRNYVEGPPVDSLTRDAQMLPWFQEDLTYVDCRQTEPPAEFFASSRINESLPECNVEVLPLSCDRVIRVFTDYIYTKEYVTDKRFCFTDNVDDADVLWFSSHYKDYKHLSESPLRRVNQFPCDHLVTVKDLLAVVCRRCHTTETEEGKIYSDTPAWMPVTYCLERELPKFVSFFQKNEQSDRDNHWIVKPWNLARGLDHSVTNNIHHIVRLPATGPKIAQKYLHNPVLFYRDDLCASVKFDLRFIVMLLSVQPLKVAVYNRFWIRFANDAFDLTELHNYQKHFTVNNYNDSTLLQMFSHEFISKFSAQYPHYSWSRIEGQLNEMFFQVFEGATKYEAPRGIPNNKQCRGFYGFDVMIDWNELASGSQEMIPKLLEVNFASDCKRACEYYPDFFNDIFGVMFLDETEGHNVTILQK